VVERSALGARRRSLPRDQAIDPQLGQRAACTQAIDVVGGDEQEGHKLVELALARLASAAAVRAINACRPSAITRKCPHITSLKA